MTDTEQYYPHPELKPLTDYPVTLRTRVDLERRICRKTIRALKAAGYELRVHSGDDWETPKKATEDNLMRAMFNLDDAWLMVFMPGEEEREGWVRFVFGNSGWDVMSDYTTNLEDVLKPVNDYADRYS
ncbi:hypothetical protein [Hyphomicrobium sp. ghe19]|uniref:hypothetical protein n=1 Tax=Hyphomicrobium sp. ghe19 TaxID=2682968 RepID=UPI0013673A8D|nr:hypothetical protein HYPP_01964 [Hyphomicrobium sp. ghe19]